MKKEKTTKKNRKGGRLIFRAWKTLPDGTRLYAKDYGFKAWYLGLAENRVPRIGAATP